MEALHIYRNGSALDAVEGGAAHSVLILEGDCRAVDERLSFPSRQAWSPNGDAWDAFVDGQQHASLDTLIDCQQGWIDREAQRIVEAACRSNLEQACVEGGVAAVDLLALKLRYAAVKLLRLVALFDELQRREAIVSRVVLHDDGCAPEYRQILEAIAAGAAWSLEVVASNEKQSTGKKSTPSRTSSHWWKRGLRSVYGFLQRTHPAFLPRRDKLRILLVGNRRVLGEAAKSLLRSDCQLAWFYEDFTLSTWWHFYPHAVKQFTARDVATGRALDVTQQELRSLQVRGVELGPALSCVVSDLLQTREGQLRKLQAAAGDALDEFAPRAILLDEDATPAARAMIRAAQSRGIPTAVVQHGAPCVRFGFAPLLADRVLCWNAASREQLIDWGIEAERVEVVGRQALGRVMPDVALNGKVVLLATVPPSDERPDAVEFHLTKHTHKQMLRAAYRGLAAAGIEQLTVKLHPRCQDWTPFEQVAAEFPQITTTFIQHAPLQRVLSRARMVLSCASSSGTEAQLMGCPVIQLLPLGSGDVLPARSWGFVGSARTGRQVFFLVQQVLTGLAQYFSDESPVSKAPRAVADAVLRLAEERDAGRTSVPSRGHIVLQKDRV